MSEKEKKRKEKKKKKIIRKAISKRRAEEAPRKNIIYFDLFLIAYNSVCDFKMSAIHLKYLILIACTCG